MKIKLIALYLACFLVATNAFTQTLTVGSFNIRYDNPRDSGNLWSTRLPRVAALIEFHEFDMVGTQEGLQHQLDGLQALLPGYTYYGIGRDDGALKGEHSAIFIKKDAFTILDKGDFWLSETRGSIEFALGCFCNTM